MDREKIKDLLDKSKISAIDEINILEYIDELEQVKEEYIKSLDKLDIYENRIDKAIEYIKTHSKCGGSIQNGKFIIENIEEIYNGMELLSILRGENENNSI